MLCGNIIFMVQSVIPQSVILYTVMQILVVVLGVKFLPLLKLLYDNKFIF